MFEPILIDSNIKLRGWNLKDTNTLTSLLNFDNTVAKSTTLPYPYNRKHALRWLRNNDPRRKAWAIEVSGKIVGCVSLDRRHGVQTAELGYWIVSTYRRLGIIKRAIALILKWWFHHRNGSLVLGRYLTWNDASGLTMQSHGFKITGSSMLPRRGGLTHTALHCSTYKA